MDTKLKQLISLLDEKGFTDLTDANLGESLLSNGIARNPKTGFTVYCKCTGYDTEGDMDDDFIFDWIIVSAEDVINEVKLAPLSFFNASDTTRDTILHQIEEGFEHSPEYLAWIISDLNAYHGAFDNSCNFAYTIEEIMKEIK
jgi:hypothetical protein